MSSKRPSILSAALEGPLDVAQPAGADEETSRRGFLENRMAGLEELTRLVKKPLMRLKPEECSIWPGNARSYQELDEKRLMTLIDSIRVENGNRVPVVVRKTPKSEKPYELIVGTRRHWAVSWLNANHYPDIELLALVHDMDDEEAFRVADIENREREDVSDLERARSYKQAIQRYYGGVQQRMAERLGIDKSYLSRLLLLADLPDWLFPAFASPHDLSAWHAYQLNGVLRDGAKIDALKKLVGEIASEQSLRLAEGKPAIEPAKVIQRLTAVKSTKAGRPRVERPPIMTHNGTPVARVLKDHRRDGLNVVIAADPDVSVDDILEALRPTIEAARFRSPK